MSKKQHLARRSEDVADTSVLETSGTAFDPTIQHLDLTRNEKRRTTALMMAIQAYRELIIKDADYLREASDLARRNAGPAIAPATVDAMVIAALKFDSFIAGTSRTDAGAGSGAVTDEDNPSIVVQS